MAPTALTFCQNFLPSGQMSMLGTCWYLTDLMALQIALPICLFLGKVSLDEFLLCLGPNTYWWPSHIKCLVIIYQPTQRWLCLCLVLPFTTSPTFWSTSQPTSTIPPLTDFSPSWYQGYHYCYWERLGRNCYFENWLKNFSFGEDWLCLVSFRHSFIYNIFIIYNII